MWQIAAPRATKRFALRTARAASLRGVRGFACVGVLLRRATTGASKGGEANDATRRRTTRQRKVARGLLRAVQRGSERKVGRTPRAHAARRCYHTSLFHPAGGAAPPWRPSLLVIPSLRARSGRGTNGGTYLGSAAQLTVRAATGSERGSHASAHDVRPAERLTHAAQHRTPRTTNSHERLWYVAQRAAPRTRTKQGCGSVSHAG